MFLFVLMLFLDPFYCRRCTSSLVTITVIYYKCYFDVVVFHSLFAGSFFFVFHFNFDLFPFDVVPERTHSADGNLFFISLKPSTAMIFRLMWVSVLEKFISRHQSINRETTKQQQQNVLVLIETVKWQEWYLMIWLPSERCFIFALLQKCYLLDGLDITFGILILNSQWNDVILLFVDA